MQITLVQKYYLFSAKQSAGIFNNKPLEKSLEKG